MPPRDKVLLFRSDPSRLHLHTTLRHFAAERQQTARRHSAYFGRLAASRGLDMRTDAWQDTQRVFLNDIENIRAAWRWSPDQNDVLCPHSVAHCRGSTTHPDGPPPAHG